MGSEGPVAKLRKRQRNLVLVRYPPTGAVDETGKRLRSVAWSSGTTVYEEAVAEAKRAEARLNAASGLLAEDTVESMMLAYVAANKLSPSYEANCLSALKAAPAFARMRLSSVNRHAVMLARD